MKKIDKLFLKAIVGPFVLTTSIVVFIFLIRFFMMYLGDILGKDLGIVVFGNLVLFFSLIVIPQALPLATLLSTLMCFGNMGEHTELTALKSAGIPLSRLILPTFVFTCFVAVGSFFYNNYVNPWANLKGYSLLWDVKSAKMTLNIQPGIFYKEIPGYRIKIQEKLKDGKTMKNILVYNHSTTSGNKSVTIADSGKMYLIKNDKYLVFELFNGKNYIEGQNDLSNTNETQFSRVKFLKNKMVLSLESFGIKRTGEDQFKYHEYMKNISELTVKIDSTRKNIKSSLASQSTQFKNQKQLMFGIVPTSMPDNKAKVVILPGIWAEKKFNTLAKSERQSEILESVLSDFRNAKSIAESDKSSIEIKQKEIWSAELERWHKITMAFSCIVLFFIGAALGSIIKKGGFGMPVLVSISFFIFLYVLMQLGDKYAKEGFIPAVVGAWIPNFVLLIIGIYLMRIASNDSRLFESDSYQAIFDKMRKLGQKYKILKKPIIAA